MSLPRKPRPIFKTMLPVAQVPCEYHPMRRSEEKILLMAKAAAQGKSEIEATQEILPAIKQLVDSCIPDTFKKVKEPLTLPDLEFLFIQIRMVSVSDTVPVTYHDPSDGVDYTFEVKLNEVNVIKPDIQPHIDLGDGLVLQMRYPSASLYEDQSFLQLKGPDQVDALIVACMDKVFEGDKMTSVSDVPVQEAIAFINDLDRESTQKVMAFLDAIPRLNYEIKYKNSKGEAREIVLSTLTDFFTFV